MPVIGSPHAGFLHPPVSLPAPFLGIWGLADRTVPPIPNPSAPGHLGAVAPETTIDTRWGGWRFESARTVTRAWAVANGCDLATLESAAEPIPYPEASEWPSFDGIRSISNNSSKGSADEGGSYGVGSYTYDGAPNSDVGSVCVSWGRCTLGAEVIECLHTGGHHSPPWREDAIFSFILRHQAPAERLPPPRPVHFDSPGDGFSYLNHESPGRAGSGVAFGVFLMVVLFTITLCGWCVRARRRRAGMLESLSHRGITPQHRSSTSSRWMRAIIRPITSRYLHAPRGAARMVEIPATAIHLQGANSRRTASGVDAGFNTPSTGGTSRAGSAASMMGEDQRWGDELKQSRARTDPFSGTVIVVNAGGNSGIVL